MDKPTKIVPADKFALFNEYWNPKIVGDLNESYIKLAKFKGEFNWHHHENEDELFIVVKGNLIIKFRDEDRHAKPGEMILIPKMVEHCPVVEEEVWVILIEPKATLNTGNTRTGNTVENLERYSKVFDNKIIAVRRVATIGNGSPEIIESSVQGILAPRRTVALLSYYRD